MKKSTKIFLWIAGVVIVGALVFAGLYVFSLRGARTLYSGLVRIQPVSLEEIRAGLDKQGCSFDENKEGALGSCIYQESERSDGKKGILIYPRGLGWGPQSFFIAEDTIWDSADIGGSPDVDVFKETVRRDVQVIGGIVQIKEESWDIKTTYPWNVIY